MSVTPSAVVARLPRLASIAAVSFVIGARTASAQDASTQQASTQETTTQQAATQQSVADQAAIDVGGEAPPADKTPKWETAKPERRGSFAMGFAVGGGVGASNGFPNDSAKIGRAKYYTESGLGFGLSSTIWIGGALADWLSFGVGFGYSNVLAKGSTSPAPFGTFHTDVYPLYPFGKAWRDLGAMFEFGLGFPKTMDSKTEETLVDGAGSSYLFAGVCWEGLSIWKLKMGPYVGAHYMFSDSVRRPMAIGGFRLTLYSLP